MPCKISWIAFPVVWVFFLPFRPRPLNWEQLRFVVCVKKVRWWILMFLASAILRERITKMFISTLATTVVRSFSFNPLWTMITNIFQSIIGRFFSKTCASSFQFRAVWVIHSTLQRNTATHRNILAPFPFSHVIDSCPFYLSLIFSFFLDFIAVSSCEF